MPWIRRKSGVWTPPPGAAAWSRRGLLRAGAAGTGAWALGGVLGGGLSGCGEASTPPPQHDTDRFYVGILADSHIIDDMYEGPEGNPLDTETIFRTVERLTAARDHLNALPIEFEQLFLVGDYIHNYPSTELDFYFENETRFDIAKQITDGFRAPIHVGFGNHDYAVPRVSLEFSHELFREKWGLEPYYSIDHRGFRFIHVNNFLGKTWDPASPDYDKMIGSAGPTQLEWLDAQLAEGLPSFVFVHYPMVLIAEQEVGTSGLVDVIGAHDNVLYVISGHWHRWFDFRDEVYPFPHLVMGSTRYDEDAYIVVELDERTGEVWLLNEGQWRWNTIHSEPWSI